MECGNHRTNNSMAGTFNTSVLH